MSNCVSLKITTGEGMKFGQLILRRIVKTVNCHQMSDFKAKMQKKIDFGWPQTPLGELTALPQTPSWIQGVLLLRAGEGRVCLVLKLPLATPLTTGIEVSKTSIIEYCLEYLLSVK